MNVVDILSKSLSSEGVDYTYEYIVTRNSLKLLDEGVVKEVQSYGIVIERRDNSLGKVFNIERDCVKNISPQRHKVQALAKMLSSNLVSPIHFIEVIGEYIDDYISDYDRLFKETSIS